VPQDVSQLYQKARTAYRSGDRGKAAYYVDQILKLDYTHRGIWKLLHREYGGKQAFKDFQRDFTEQYYPDKADLLTGKTSVVKPSGSPAVKAGLLARISAVFKRSTSSRNNTVAKAEKIEIEAPPVLEPTLDKQSSDTPTRPILAAEQEAVRSLSMPVEALPVVKKEPPPPVVKPVEKTAGTVEPKPSAPVRQTSPLDKAAKIRVMVVDDTVQTRETIIRSLNFEREIEVVATADSGSQAIKLAKQTRPDVVLMDINMPDMDGITATAAVLSEVPYTQIVILTVQNDADYIRRAMLAGARDFITKPPALDDLLQAVLQAGRIAHQEKRKVLGSHSTGPLHAPAVSAQGKIITIYSPKGGSGCSMVAANLAAALHNEETTVILLDTNLQYGDMPDLFKLQARQTLFELAQHADDLDYDIVEGNAITHESGIKIVAPPGITQSESITDNQFVAVLDYLRDLYPYVLLNASSHLSNTSLAALEMSDIVILLITQDISAITKVGKFLDTLNLLKIDSRRVLLVLNQYDKQQEIQPEIIEKTIRQPIAALIPRDDRLVLASINKGVPFMLVSDVKSTSLAHAFMKLTETVRQRLFQLAEKPSEPEPVGSRGRG
jgi:pilus assembly protein CpaE